MTVFFVHIQKTGGTALYRRLKRSLAAELLYPNESDGDPVSVAPQLLVERLQERWADRGHEIGIIAGHFPLCTVDLLDGDFTTATVLREPVERTLSYLRHHRQLTPVDADRGLEAIYDDDVRYRCFIHNHMTKMLGLTLDEMTDGMLTRVEFTQEHLDRALGALGTVDVLGVQERFDDFCHAVERHTGWDLGEPMFANRTAAIDVPESFRRRIESDNEYDVALYRAAVERLAV